VNYVDFKIHGSKKKCRE